MAATPQPAGDGPVVVVTGASAGVGRAVARAYGRRGARVGLIARNEAGLEAAAREVEDGGGRALVLPTDVADAAAVERAAARVAAELGAIDIWVNDAMATVLAPLWRIEPGEFRRTTEVTYLGQVYGTMAALRRMLPSDRGTIVQIGSALAYRGIPLQSAYCGAKHAVRGFTDALRCELRHAGSNVQVVTVHLPALNTTQFDLVRTRMPRSPRPVAPVYEPEVAAEAILWAADHPHRREVWVGGSTVLTIIGNRIAPRLADWYLARKGFDSQQTDQPVDDRRRHTDYLFQPVPGDHGVHGAFDGESKRTSRQLWLTERRRALLAAGAAGAAAAVAAGLGALAARAR